jgi:two-component system, chemotaxis family, chemotaxis protein CheV
MSDSDVSLSTAVDARTQSAGANRMEILLFSLGTRETFGINVFKVREVSQTPAITKSPNMPVGVVGVLSLRGNIIPVVSLARFLSPENDSRQYDAMIVTEFNKSTLAFLVDSVDRIIHVDWDRVRAPDNMMLAKSSTQPEQISAITELDDGSLVSIIDVEHILASVIGDASIPDLPHIEMEPGQFLFFADDSIVARKEITKVLEKMGVPYQQANNGREAWERLQIYATRSVAMGEPLHDSLKAILVDAEMPEMDGYVLARMIKADNRFEDVPVIMHSSLSSNATRMMSSEVGVDAYVTKFDARALADALVPFLLR